MTKKNLQEKIKCLEHNLRVAEETHSNQYQVLLKLTNLLEQKGVTTQEINNYVCDKSNDKIIFD
jgi:hypothetical protein